MGERGDENLGKGTAAREPLCFVTSVSAMPLRANHLTHGIIDYQ